MGDKAFTKCFVKDFVTLFYVHPFRSSLFFFNPLCIVIFLTSGMSHPK